MNKPDRKVYQMLINPRVWGENRKRKSTTVRAQENRFREIVEKYGSNKHSSSLSAQINKKWQQLMNCSPEKLKEVEMYLDKCR